MAKHGAHAIHLRMVGGAATIGPPNHLDNGASGAVAESAAADYLRDRRGNKAGPGQAVDGRLTMAVACVEVPPTIASEASATGARRRGNVFKCFRHGQTWLQQGILGRIKKNA